MDEARARKKNEREAMGDEIDEEKEEAVAKNEMNDENGKVVKKKKKVSKLRKTFVF